MASLEETIPAFSMWQIFYDTMSRLPTRECSANSIKQLENTINSRELAQILVYSHNPQLPFEQYDTVSQRYVAFTTWLLGQFFHLLSCENLSRMHQIATNAQLKILHQISCTEPRIYHKLTQEYCSILQWLNKYRGGDAAHFEVFKPHQFSDLSKALDLQPTVIEVNSIESCRALKSNILVFIEQVILNNLTSNFLNDQVYSILDELVRILKDDILKLKLLALEIYRKILEAPLISIDTFPFKLKEKFRMMEAVIERLTYDLFKLNVEIDPDSLRNFEAVLLSFFKHEGTHNFTVKVRLSKFIVNNLEDLDFKIEKQLEVLASKFLLRECPKEVTMDFMPGLQMNNTDIKLMFLERMITDELKQFLSKENARISDVQMISKSWLNLYDLIKTLLFELSACEQECRLKETLEFVCKVFHTILRSKLLIQVELEYFNETEFIMLLISFVNAHLQNCKVQIPHNTFLKVLTLMPLFTSKENIDLIFHVIAYPFLPMFYKSNSNLPVNIVGCSDRNEAERNMKLLYNKLALLEESKDAALENVCRFMFLLLVDLGQIKSASFNQKFMKIILNLLPKSSVNMQLILARNLPHIITSCKHMDESVTTIEDKAHLLGQILNHLTQSQDKNVLLEVSKNLAKAVCNIYSDYKQIFLWTSKDDDDDLGSIKYICNKCNREEYEDNEDAFALPDVNKAVLHEAMDNTRLFQCVWRLSKTTETEVKVNFIKALPALAKHVWDSLAQFVSDWIQYAGDTEKSVRTAFSQVLSRVLEVNAQEQILDECLKALFVLTKKSIQYSNFELQITLLYTLESITDLKIKSVTPRVVKILLYFIMLPTSKHTAIAEYFMNELALKQGRKAQALYTTYRKEFCQNIAELCAINQALIKYDLNDSLEKVTLLLGFSGTKHFVTSENSYLLPFFVPLIVQMPPVTKLIAEIASLMEVSLSELLQNNYSVIFLHIFLNENDEAFKYCMNYLEKVIGIKGSLLRKRNLRAILNELLLNFSEKQDRVLLALKLLSREDTDGQVNNIPDYLQPCFLGVLYHFDTRLTKLPVLLSLVQLFKFMGPKNIAPFRFKIIAMLRTALSNYSPDLNCEVWDAFVRSCDTEALGPQLATIFVSLLPYTNGSCEEKMNEIFKYLVVENEACLKDYIPDLFFALDFNISYEVQLVIKKYITFGEADFREHLKWLLKYLTHETNEVRSFALKYLKNMMEENREELDRMILGYNGIETIIIDLLDILMVGCRSKDQTMKLMSGECIGELGAIEPSHLPRKYTQAQSFSFLITEDNFILNSLGELIRAFQAEKNTKCMDRFALAIQETLKHYRISPDVTSTKHSLWNSFSQPQQELMLPLLSSRYVIGQSLEPVKVSPIYGTSHGTNFRNWVYNWTWSLIATIKPEKRSLLEVYLPSLKDDHRILMQFLPHILLHSLLEGGPAAQRKAYDECMAVINSLNTKKPITTNLLNTRLLREPHIVIKGKQKTFEEDVPESQCIKVLFVLLDFLDRWMREWEWQRNGVGREHEDYKTIQLFLSKFCKLQLAKCNFQCEEYTRALMYLEDYIIKNPNELDEQLPLLARIYAQLNEADAVAGVTALQQNEPTLEQKILALEVSGKLSEASACYGRIPPPLKLHHLQGLIQCYLDLDNVNVALKYAEGAIAEQPEFENVLLEVQAEPFWRLGRYDDLENLLAKPELDKNDSWGVQVGHLLLHSKNGKKNEFQNVLSALRTQQVNSLGATSLEEGAYQHGYHFIAKLHSLNELEQIEKLLGDLLLKANDHDACKSIIQKLMNEWELRIKVVQESVKIIEPILCLRRVMLQHAKHIVKDRMPQVVPLLDSLLGETWLTSAKIARHNGNHQQAYTYALKAEEFALPCLFLEKAKLHWMREEHEQALMYLRRGVDKILPEVPDKNVSPSEYLTLEQRKICAKAKLLFATYNDSISNVDTEVNIKYYKEAVDMLRECEKSLVLLAQYYDRIFQNLSEEDKDVKGSDMQIHMINYFGKSLQYGTTYIYQSMPRLLSIWFDYGTRLLNVTSPAIKEERKTSLLKMTKLIDTFLERLPAYIFLTAFSQIVSRICHPQREVYVELKSIIIKLILKYPQQSMWMMISVMKSSYAVRSKRCAEILGDPKLKTPSMVKLITDFTKLAEKLIELCNKEIPEGVATANVNTLLRSLPRLLSKDDFSEIMIPTQRFRKLVLPNPDFKTSQHNPFPNQYVHIVGIEDEVVILQSLQRPKKIVLKGSDGKRYIQMLKPKDDLRKDFRLMEFNDIVNQMLSREADSRQQRLNIRLYSVVPLNEECGLIEWVPDLVGLRPVLMTLYKQRGLGMKGRELKESCCNIRDSLSKKKAIFLEKLLPRYPPILGEWFRRTFPDAQGWLTARTAYTRTTAVISMVGYILGLGDRHGENILLDSTNGDTVHVDFNCLFNKGESFEYPERVPFRLTHNMVSAMGPLGVEGVFRKSCACTLRVLRTYTNTLMSIVTPFVYDPLVSWPRNTAASTSALNSERTNEQAVEHVRNIELRLQGMIRTRTRSISIPLSVEGQANTIISEAMNIDNLCQMYIGWGAYL